MRFKRLKLTNITSLRGEHTLDFGEALGDEELFAITGATGSGKSSLLTAISLALFGDTHKKNVNQWEYVTQDEVEGSIDLEFTSNGIDYRALWSCKKHVDKHGVLKPKYPKQLLANGEPIDRPIEEIIGLNFEQFKKTIILNQGQFAEFLTATFTERKAILENLAGAELLSDISRTLKERVREMARVQGELEAKLEGGLPFPEEELAQMREKVTALEQQKPLAQKIANRFKEDERDFQDLTKSLEGIKRYRAEEEGTKLELQSANDLLQISKDEHREWLNKFNDFIQKRDQRRPQLQLALKIEKELETKKVQEKSLSDKDQERLRREKQWEQEKKQWHMRLNAIADELSSLAIDLDYSKLTQSSLNAVEALLTEWDEALKQHSVDKTKLESALERMNATKKRGKDVAAELEKCAKELDGVSTSHKDMANLAALQQELEALVRDLPLWEEQGRIREDLKRRIDQKKTELKDIKEQLIKREEKLHVSTLEYENAKLKKRQYELEHALELIRNKGEEDGTCPACGHDWPTHLDHKSNTCEITVGNIEELGASVASQTAQIDNLKHRIIDLEVEIDSLINQDKESSKKQELLAKTFGNPANINTEVLRDRRVKLQAEVKLLEEASRKAQQLKDLLTQKELERDQLRSEWNAQNKIKEEVETSIEKSTALIKRSYNDLKSRIPAIPERFEDARTFIKIQVDLSHQKSKLEQEKLSLSERIEAGEKEAALRTREYAEDAKKRTILLQEIQHSYEQLKPLVPEGDATKAMRALETQEDEWNKEKDRWNGKLKELEQKTESARTRHGFMIEQVKKARTELERILALISSRETPENANQGFCRGHEKLCQLKQAFEVENASSEINVWYTDFFIPEAIIAKENLKKIETELIELNKSLDIDARKRREMDKFKQELDAALAQKKRWDALADVLGQDEFRSFALGLVEERLVAQTNRELEHLCEGRYQITLLENKKQSQDFLVVDHWRGGGERKVSTLSGGETFLVSLAMALSLAELTRGQTEVDAFFIDEGFGTLDRDSIDDVLEVLSNVQSRGKQIGLISHVKALTDRIPVNLHLEKSTLGDSKIRVVYN